MHLPDFIRNSKTLRWPLLAASKLLFTPLRSGPQLLRRAAYDAMPTPYLVTGNPEHFVVSTADKVIGREVFLHGEFDFNKLLTALAILEREGLPRPAHLIDVGANIGTITIPAIKRGLMQTATAIEPHPDNLRLLRANLALNGIDDRVAVLAQAVGDVSNTTLHLQESATNSGNHAIADQGIPVKSSRLDDLADMFPEQCLLWMDIEGYEGHALKGATNLLAKGTPVVCEFNSAYLKQTQGLLLLKNALEGFSFFDLKSSLPNKITLEDVERNYPGGDNFTDILAIRI
ncbi:MAG: FkbM family methyltransferase, partial [Comamonas sp.]|nr:FkbM family methyltransferase [Comamonas sp.]